MPPAVRSKTLTQLYSDLGYCGKYPGREQKDLDNLLQYCELETLDAGSPLHLLKPDSKVAKALASQVLKSGQRGQNLWPNNAQGDWPSWSTRRKK
jgi:hypothetical protein